jgi:MFS family permease
VLNSNEDPTTQNDQRGLSPTVVRLGLVSFFADVSSEMLYPITPLFLTMVLHTSVANVGLIEGVAEGVASLLKTFSGLWSDRIQKRKVFVWMGYLCAAVAKPLIGGASSWPQVLFARSFDRFGKGIRTAPRDALLSESVDSKNRGAAFGWHRAMDTLGAAVGPLLALCYLHFHSKLEDLRSLYLYALVPGLLSVLIVFLVRETSKKKSEKKSPSILSRQVLTPTFRRYLVAWGVFSLVNSSDVFLLLKAQSCGLTLTTTILLYAFYNLIYATLSPYFGSLSDRIGRKTILVGGLAVFSFVYVCFGFATEMWEFWILFGIYGVYMAATDGVGKALAVDLVPPELKASGIGVLGTVSGVSSIVASSVAGLLWDHLGTGWPFFYGAAGALLAAALMISLPRARV